MSKIVVKSLHQTIKNTHLLTRRGMSIIDTEILYKDRPPLLALEASLDYRLSGCGISIVMTAYQLAGNLNDNLRITRSILHRGTLEYPHDSCTDARVFKSKFSTVTQHRWPYRCGDKASYKLNIHKIALLPGHYRFFICINVNKHDLTQFPLGSIMAGSYLKLTRAGALKCP